VSLLATASLCCVLAHSRAGDTGGLRHSKPIKPIGQSQPGKDSKSKEAPPAWFPESVTVLSVGTTNYLWEVPDVDTREMVLSAGQKVTPGGRITVPRIVDGFPEPTMFKVVAVSSNRVTLGKANSFEQKTVPLIVRK
jgi:hypothetical protein